MKRNQRLIKVSERLYQAAFSHCLHSAVDPAKTDENDAYKQIEEWAILGQSRSREYPHCLHDEESLKNVLEWKF